MVHGGKRAGAGRPKGKGLYGTIATTTMRVPENMVEDVRQYAMNMGNKVPLYTSNMETHHSVPANDHAEEMIDIHSYLIKNSATTFCVKVSGESMIGDGINDGDILIADSRIEAKHDQIVIAVVDDILTIKRLAYRNGQPFLLPENPIFQAIPIKENSSVYVWGTVINIVHSI